MPDNDKDNEDNDAAEWRSLGVLLSALLWCRTPLLLANMEKLWIESQTKAGRDLEMMQHTLCGTGTLGHCVCHLTSTCQHIRKLKCTLWKLGCRAGCRAGWDYVADVLSVKRFKNRLANALPALTLIALASRDLQQGFFVRSGFWGKCGWGIRTGTWQTKFSA